MAQDLEPLPTTGRPKKLERALFLSPVACHPPHFGGALSLVIDGLAGAIGVDGDGVLGALHWHPEGFEDRVRDVLGVELLHLVLLLLQ